MRTMIAIPCMDMVHTGFMTSLIGLNRVGEIQLSIVTQSLIYDARNELAIKAIQGGCDRILWIDSDMRFAPDTLERLSADMDATGCDAVAGLFFKRTLPTEPVIYSRLDYYPDAPQSERIKIETAKDYPKDTLFQVGGFGFGCVLTTTQIVKDVWDKCKIPPFLPELGMGEDMSFCWRVSQIGGKMYCDSAVKVGHIGQIEFNERTWLAQNRG